MPRDCISVVVLIICCRGNHLTVISLASDTSTAWFLVCFCGVYILHPTAQCTGTPTYRHLSKHCPEVPAHRHSELGKQPQKVPAHSTQAHIVPNHCVPVHQHITPSSHPKTHQTNQSAQSTNIPEIHPTKTGWGPTPKNQQTLRKHPSATPHPCDLIEK